MVGIYVYGASGGIAMSVLSLDRLISAFGNPIAGKTMKLGPTSLGKNEIDGERSPQGGAIRTEILCRSLFGLCFCKRLLLTGFACR